MAQDTKSNVALSGRGTDARSRYNGARRFTRRLSSHSRAKSRW
ncbi:MAG: hypothetical protein CMLOHMNK_00169 [Steroidobacteraceae bacterium]|nr:hypothetical protein [Steroidobacteraceae bacterium]